MKKQEKKPLPSYPAASHANPFHQPDDERDLQMKGICGRKCTGLSGNCTPLGCLEKMLLASSIWGSTKRLLIWKRRVTPLGFSYYLLSPSARGMSEKELSSSALLFPTPLASDTRIKAEMKNVRITKNGSVQTVKKDGTEWTAKLSTAVYYLTPMASDSYRSTLKPSAILTGKKNGSLAAQLIYTEKPKSDTAALNPDWVEWLMGFPRKWTDVPFGAESRREYPD